MTRLISEANFSPNKVLDRIAREAIVFSQAYYGPKKDGVINLFVPQHVNERLHGNLTYIRDNFLAFENRELATTLSVGLLAMGQVMGFDERGFAARDDSAPDHIDLSGLVPTKDGKPFFAWRPGENLTFGIDYNEKVPENVWMERETGLISDSRSNVAYRGAGLTVFTTLPNSMQSHGLSFHKKYVANDSDTRLSFDCGYSWMEGFQYSISFNLKDGKLMSVTDGRNTSDVASVFHHIQDKLGVTPQHIAYYLNNSNLTEAHKRDMSDVFDVLSGYPEKDVYELFDAQKPSLVSRIKSLLPGTLGYVTQLDSSRVDINALSPHYQYVTLDALTTDELRSTGLPDDKLTWVTVDFKSPAGNAFSVSYQPEHPKGPYISLVTKGHKDMLDFRAVASTLRHGMNFSINGGISDRSNDLCGTYNLPSRPTQATIANEIETVFANNFENVRVDGAMFSDVPASLVERVALPSERVKPSGCLLL